MGTRSTQFLRVVETRQALRAAQAAFEGARDNALRTHVGVAARRVEHENARQAAATLVMGWRRRARLRRRWWRFRLI